MRLHLLLAKVEPKAIPVPSKCAYPNCTSKRVQLHQPVKKALRDTVHKPGGSASLSLPQMRAHLPGLSARSDPCAIRSERVKGLAVMVYLFGLSYGAVSLALERVARAALQDTSLRDGASRRCT